MLELESQVTVELVDIFQLEALTIGRVADEGAALGHLVDFVDVAAFELDVFVKAGILDVGTRNGNGLALDVAAVYLVGELALSAVIVIDALKQLGIIVGPILERIAVAVHARSDVGTDKGCLDEEGARAAHGVYQVGLAVPAAQQDDACRQHLVDGCVGLSHAPAAFEQRLAAAVKRQGDVAPRDVDVKTDFGIGQADAGSFAVFLVEVVGDGVLDAIGDKA